MDDYEDFEPGDGGYEDDYERESPEVYRRRRIIAAIIAVLVIVLVVWGIVFAVNKVTGSSDSGASAATSSQADNFASFSARPSSSAGASEGASDQASASASDQPSASASGDQGKDAAAGKKDDAQKSSPAAAPAKPAAPAEPQACTPGALQVAATVDKPAYTAGQNPVLTAQVSNTGSDPCTVDLGTSHVTYQITSGPAQVFDSSTCPVPAAAQQQVTVDADGKQSAQITWPRQVTALGCGDKATAAQPGYYWLTVSVDGVPSEKKPILLQ